MKCISSRIAFQYDPRYLPRSPRVPPFENFRKCYKSPARYAKKLCSIAAARAATYGYELSDNRAETMLAVQYQKFLNSSYQL